MSKLDIKSDDNIKKKYNFLYPLLSQSDFNIKIAEKREFYDTRYPEETKNNRVYIAEHGDFLCNEREFELMPHQMFVRNFLSNLTPYNGLLLFHGTGTGKTCTSISVCEEMRAYYKHINSPQKILIIASPNVKENFKIQLFDSRKLKKINGVWNLRACTGSTYLREINPMNMKNLKKENVIKEVKKIIRNSYKFIGYTEFSNIIEKHIGHIESKDRQNKILNKIFSNNLIVIDEAHNIRDSIDNPNKKVAINLMKVVKAANNLKLLLLSATPMYNSHEEILWLLNILNANDNRSVLQKSDIFDSDGNFVINSDGEEIGKERLKNKAIGYISYLRGNNPFTFPYRLWPIDFAKGSPVSLSKLMKSKRFHYPKKQINDIDILDPPKNLDLYMIELSKYQREGYQAIINNIRETIQSSNTIKGLGYEVLFTAVQALDFVYPHKTDIDDVKQLIGFRGLKHTMNFNKQKQNFSYKRKIQDEFGRFFSEDNLKNYSSKMHKIVETIKRTDGIILIYSQYINAGCLPMALALEELGITRYGRKPLFKESPHPPIDYKTMKPKTGDEDSFIPAKYAMITGDVLLSPNRNKDEMSAITNPQNINGELVKVVIISKAGAEGLDFKNIRQVHVLEPWYNLNRIEQVIGRAVRTCSHKALPFSKRNVEIYLYATNRVDKKNLYEAADLYVYRKAYIKAKKIGVISRLLKKNAADCQLNSKYNNLSINKKVKMQLSSKNKVISFNIKSKPYSALCDYMKQCKFDCSPSMYDIASINDDTYTEEFIIMNMDKIMQRIRVLMKEQFIYTRFELIAHIRAQKDYPLMQIESALDMLVNEKNEYITDMFGRIGNLVNIDTYYMFQPLEIDNKQIPYYERTHLIKYKRDKLIFSLPKEQKIVMRRSDILQKINEYMLCIISDEKCSYIEYASVYASIEYLVKPPFNIPKAQMENYMYMHIFDSLGFQDKVEIMNILWSRENLNDISQQFKQIIIKHFILYIEPYNCLPLINKKSSKKIEEELLIFKKNKWVIATKQDKIQNDFETPLNKKYMKKSMGKIIGFMGTTKNVGFKFKTIIIEKKSNRSKKGFQCITQQKRNTMNLLNELMSISPIADWHDIHFSEDTTNTSANHILIKRGFSRNKLCNIQELVLRYFNSISKSHTWFFSSFEAFKNKIEE